MGNRTRWLALALAVLCLSTGLLGSCGQEAKPSESMPEQETDTVEDQTMQAKLLNGTWDFFKDEDGKEIRFVPEGNRTAEKTFRQGEDLRTHICIPDAGQVIYGKIVLPLTFSNDLKTRNGERPYVEASLNGGPYFRTFIRDLIHNPEPYEHTIDMGYVLTDLISGQNELTFRTNVTEGTMTARVYESGDTDACILVYPMLFFKSSAVRMNVPGAWELQLDDKNEYTAYDGVGWYRTSFDRLKTMEDSQAVLRFSAVDYYAEIFVNDRFICSHEDGYSPIEINFADYPELLRPSGNELTVRVTDQSLDKNARFQIKQTLAGFFHDSVGINFAGIWNDVELSERGALRIGDLTILPDCRTGDVNTTVTLVNHGSEETTQTLCLAVTDPEGRVLKKKTVEVTVLPNEVKDVPVSVRVNGFKRWQVSDPQVYGVTVSLNSESRAKGFGFTEIVTDGRSILFNGKAILLNGILSWLGNWDKLSPNPDPETFRSQIRTLKAHGFNAIKFCLVVPPEYLLDICDREGIYVYIEYPIWNPVKTDAFYDRAYSQMGRFVSMGKNHPSVIMSDFNCEMPAFDDRMTVLMDFCVNTGRQIDPNRLFTDNSSTGQQNPDSGIDFWTFHPYSNALDFAKTGQGFVDMRNARGDKPTVFGEYADYPALAEFGKILAANGGKEPWNWKVVDDPFRADLYYEDLGYSDEQIRALIEASRTNSIDMKMHIVQETKKIDGIAGYFLTIIQDIGHSVTGFFDELGNTKWVPAQTEFLRDAVLLMDKTIYNYEGGVDTAITPAISNFSGTDIRNGTLTYRLVNKQGTTVLEDELLDELKAPNGCYTRFDVVNLRTPDVTTGEAFTLSLTLTDDAGLRIENHWDVFVFPHIAPLEDVQIMVSGDTKTRGFMSRYPNAEKWTDGAEPDLLVTYDRLTTAQLTYLNNGGKVLYLGHGSEALTVEKGTYYSQYVLVSFPDPDHEIIKAIPTKGFGGTQFLELQTEYVITAYRDDPLPSTLIGKVLLRDNVPDNLQTGSYMTETTIGQGQLIQCTLNLEGDPVLGHGLIDAAIRHLKG